MVRTDDDWQYRKFPQLSEALEKPLSEDNRANPYRNPNKVYHANQYQTECVYCKKSDHKSADCQTVKTIFEHRKLLSEKNYASIVLSRNIVSQFKTCLICKNKHQTSICDKSLSASAEPLLTTTENNIIYPVAIVKIKGVKCQVLLDTDSGSSYASENLLDYLKINPTRKEIKTNKTLNKFNYQKT